MHKTANAYLHSIAIRDQKLLITYAKYLLYFGLYFCDYCCPNQNKPFFQVLSFFEIILCFVNILLSFAKCYIYHRKVSSQTVASLRRLKFEVGEQTTIIRRLSSLLCLKSRDYYYYYLKKYTSIWEYCSLLVEYCSII